MARYFTIHPDDPQPRLISQTAAILRHGGVIVYPTDSCYALGCLAMDKTAVDRIIHNRRLNPKHNMTLICSNLSDISTYARLDNTAFRLIKRLTPGPYTFLLKATKDVPKRLWHPQRKTIGLRVPDHAIVRDILVSLGEPMLSTSLILPDEQLPETEPEQIYKRIGNVVDLIIEGGACGFDPTTVLDLTGPDLEVIRKGRGDITGLI
ncbi:MAG: L-threonylcarbamoyladenylate synthase [Gammaproteobacteria bacterium]|nr:L-threonylcarbamoyladenylate synthase [Gammaproteobacteria bacterium]